MQTTVARKGGSGATPTRYAWWVVLMLWFICMLNYADRQAVFAVFPRLEHELHLTKPQLGFIGSAFMWTYAAFSPAAGHIADRVRRRSLILGGCIFWSSVTAATGWCAAAWQFITVRGLEGLGESCYFPASISMLSDYHGPSTRSRALSIHQSGVYVGTVLGSWVGASIAERYNWRLGFYLFGGSGIVLALALVKSLREPARESSFAGQAVPAGGPPEMRFASFFNPAVCLLMAAFVMANFVATVFLTWTPTFLAEKHHFRLGMAGLTGSVYIQAASALAVPLAGHAADKLTRRLASGRILVQAAGLLAGATFVGVVGSTGRISTLICAMAGFGFCKGFYDSGIFASLYDLVAPAQRGAAAGWMNTVGWGGGALGPVAVGWISTHGHRGSEMANMSAAISFGAVLYLAGAALLIAAAWAKQYAVRGIAAAEG